MGVTSIPGEILDVILENEKLAISDVMNFALTCKQIYEDVTTSNRLWKTKTLQRWAFFEQAFNNADKAEVFQINWFEEMKAQMFRRKQLKKYLSELSATNYGRLQLSDSDMKVLDTLLLPEINARSANYHLLMEELGMILDEDTENLCDDYWTRKMMKYTSRTYVTLQWPKFLALPEKKQTIERGMLLISQWMQQCRCIYAIDITNLLDDIANLTRELIAEEHPDLQINQTSFAEEAEWRDEILDDNKWSAEDSKIIISAICKTIFTTLGFEVNTVGHTLEIDVALAWKCDDDISMMTIFEAVARRLGLRFEIIGYRQNIKALLRWKERYIPGGDGVDAIYYLDILLGKTSLVRENWAEAYDEMPAVTVFEMLIRMATNIDWESERLQQFSGRRSSREFLHMIRPQNIGYLLRLIDFYIWKGLNFGELVASLKNIRDKNEWLDPNDDTEFYEEQYGIWEEFRKRHLLELPKMRTPQVQYAVGMIMNYRNMMSVITGWDATKYINVDGLAEQQLPNLRYGDKQPFYSISCEDSSIRYVPQETLTVAESPEVVSCAYKGRYLYRFMGRYYLPNAVTARMYPEDVELLNKLYEC